MLHKAVPLQLPAPPAARSLARPAVFPARCGGPAGLEHRGNAELGPAGGRKRCLHSMQPGRAKLAERAASCGVRRTRSLGGLGYRGMEICSTTTRSMPRSSGSIHAARPEALNAAGSARPVRVPKYRPRLSTRSIGPPLVSRCPARRIHERPLYRNPRRTRLRELCMGAKCRSNL